MTTWTLDQVNQVARCYVRFAISSEWSTAYPETLTDAKERCAQRLKHDLHPYAVEIHPADVQFDQEHDDVFGGIILTAHWWPSTRQVELRGGHVDGTVIELNGNLDPIQIARPPAPISTLSQYDTVPEPRVPHLTFELSGWDETNHRWVYTTR